MKILEAQPFTIPTTVMKKLQGYIGLALAHGNLCKKKNKDKQINKSQIYKGKSIAHYVMEANVNSEHNF